VFHRVKAEFGLDVLEHRLSVAVAHHHAFRFASASLLIVNIDLQICAFRDIKVKHTEVYVTQNEWSASNVANWNDRTLG
jgi:hypothetical protein